MGRYVKFDKSGYEAALSREFDLVMDKVSSNVYRMMLLRLSSLKIRKADQRYRGEIQHAIKRVQSKTTGKLVSTFIGGGDPQPNQSFRVIYYEYGTGTRMRPPATWNPGDDPSWNPNRSGRSQPFYYRKGEWTDLGGNVHKSKFKGGDKVKINPQKNPYGEEIFPQHWFSNSLKAGSKNLDQLVLNAVKKVPITSYIVLRDMRERM